MGACPRSTLTVATVTGTLRLHPVPHREFADWWKGLSAPKYLTSSKYCTSVNKYGVTCGQSLEAWEGSGWIVAQDPFGWFQVCQ